MAVPLRRAWATDATALPVKTEPANICSAVLSGMVRMLALLACIAGAGSAGRIGTAARAIDFPRLLGVNWGEAPRGDHPWKKFYINIFPS